MAASGSGVNEVAARWADLSLEEEDDIVVEAPTSEIEDLAIDHRWCLVGRLLTGRVSDFHTFQNLMASLWQPGRGMYVKEIGSNLYLFQFNNETDIQRVIDGSPWTYDRKQLILQRLYPGQVPMDLSLDFLDMWVQLHDLRPGYMSQRILETVGNNIGEFLSSDPNNFTGARREYLRTRVRVPLAKPLKRRMKVKTSETSFFWVNFKYERVPTFCFICGMMGHAEKYCDKLCDTPMHLIAKPYGIEMRATGRRPLTTIGSKWLLPEMRFGREESHRSGGGEGAENQPSGMENQAVSTLINVHTQNQANLHDSRLARIPADQPLNCINVDSVHKDGSTEVASLLIFSDSKRRRVADGHVEDSGGDVDNMEYEDTSKNGLSTGTGIQARHSS